MKYYLLMIAFILLSCSSKEIGKATYGHWIYRGSSTFQQVFQCVEEFPPHQNKEC